MAANKKTGGDSRLSEKKNRVSRFHRRQSLYIFVGFLMLVSFLILMLNKQYITAKAHEEDRLIRDFRERINYLDSILSSVTEHVDGLRIVAETDLLQSKYGQTLEQPVEFGYLQEGSKGARYSLDHFRPPITQEMIGNLTGMGSFLDKDAGYYRELHMALILNPQFRVISQSLKNAAWIYYTSKNNFINIYPWVSSDDFRFTAELHTHEFYKLGTPEYNAQRTRFWTEVYIDEYGKGLMTTCAAPVYDGDRFLGTVAIDLTVDFLNTVVKEFNSNKGVMFLVNDREQLLAHPTLITSNDKKTKTLSEALPDEYMTLVRRLPLLPEYDVIQVNSLNVLKGHLKQAPWQVIYYEPIKPFSASLVEMIGPGPLAVLGIFLIFVITIFTTTEKQFILPSRKFVSYILNRSQQVDTPKETRIPAVWKPWFDIIDSVFSENEKLTEEILRQNEDLEERVQIRTAELQNEVEERKAAEAEKENLIEELKMALAEVKTLQGFIPICAHCKKIRDDEGFWQQIEEYIQDRSDAEFSHSICPECLKKLNPDLAEKVFDRLKKRDLDNH